MTTSILKRGDRIVSCHSDYSGSVEAVDGSQVQVFWYLTRQRTWQPATSVVRLRDWSHRSHYAKAQLR